MQNPYDTRKYKIGVITIGSLFWQNDLFPDKNDNLRRVWRENFLETHKPIEVTLPIRYGRRSSANVFTMVFSNDLESQENMGLGKIISLKKEVDFEELLKFAREMACAEGIANGSLYSHWCCISILPNRDLLPEEDIEELEDLWSSCFNNDKRISNPKFKADALNKDIINEKGVLDISWPKIKEKKAPKYDLLIAAVTASEKEFPSTQEIAKSVLNDFSRKYFFNNIDHNIQTYQDDEIIEEIANIN